MPISGGKYVAPTWVDNAPPALGATELQAISDSVESYADPVAQIPWFTRPNLLDNWYFVGGGSQQGGGQFPVNSLGQTSYNASNIYTIDRWKTSHAFSVELQSDSIALTTSGAYNHFLQLFESVDMVKGRTVTISAFVKGTAGRHAAVALYDNNASTIYGRTSYELTGNWQIISETVTVPNSANVDRFMIYPNRDGISNDVVQIKSMKLEVGSTQTLAHQENGSWVLNEIPNFDEQYMRCAILPGVPIRIEHGSYVGTGTYGSGNPSSLTFGFVPKTIIIYEDGTHVQNIEAIYGSQYVRVTYSTTNTATPTWDGSTTFKWYASGASNQMNSSGVSYYYVAIG